MQKLNLAVSYMPPQIAFCFSNDLWRASKPKASSSLQNNAKVALVKPTTEMVFSISSGCFNLPPSPRGILFYQPD
jgi:hypothetical protein